MSDIQLMGATYPDVPAVKLPKSGGGEATFTEVGGSQTYTQNGTYDVSALSEAVVNVSGGGGSSNLKGIIERTVGSIELPSDLTRVGNYAFYGCSSLDIDEMPSGVTSIDRYAFHSCTNLSLTSLPDNITLIDQYAFYNCSSLALTSLPSSLTTINQYAFWGCSGIRLSVLPSNLTTVGGYAFYTCNGCTFALMPSRVSTIGNYAFYKTRSTFTELSPVLTSIGQYAFSECPITSIRCTGTITTFGTQAFRNCQNLTRAEFPNMSIATLPVCFGQTSATYADKALELVDLGKSAGVSANAFANCYALETLIIRKSGAVATLANVSAFSNTPFSGRNGGVGKLYVPSSLVSAYQTANNWKTLYNNGTMQVLPIEGSDYEL